MRSLCDPIIGLALEEDLGPNGDLTGNAIFSADDFGSAHLVAREAGTFSGSSLVGALPRVFGTGIEAEAKVSDGSVFGSGTHLLTLRGRVREILIVERTLINFLGHLCAVADRTRHYAEAIEGTGARLLCTRKTLPGLRRLQRQAVRDGGGHCHRFGLSDGYLVKDNHIAAAGSLESAIERIRAVRSPLSRIEVEVDTFAQLDTALAAGVDMILLDNFTAQACHEAVARVAGRALLEASGAITLDTIRPIAQSGVDYVSVGALTKSAGAIDMSLDWDA